MMTPAQSARGMAIFVLILLTCSILPVAMVTGPLLVYVAIRFLQERRRLQARRAVLEREVKMARYAASMKRWTT